MAKAKLSPFIDVHGKIGNISVARYGEIYRLRKLPQRTPKPPSPKQKTLHERLVAATRYAVAALAQPELKAIYAAAARLRGKRAYDLAKADFLHPPRITDIDLSNVDGRPGQTIRITAEDDFEVYAVSVRLAPVNGVTLEEGPATRMSNSSLWSYPLKSAIAEGTLVSVEATAMDRAGNSVRKCVDHACRQRP